MSASWKVADKRRQLGELRPVCVDGRNACCGALSLEPAKPMQVPMVVLPVGADGGRRPAPTDPLALTGELLPHAACARECARATEDVQRPEVAGVAARGVLLVLLLPAGVQTCMVPLQPTC